MPMKPRLSRARVEGSGTEADKVTLSNAMKSPLVRNKSTAVRLFHAAPNAKVGSTPAVPETFPRVRIL